MTLRKPTPQKATTREVPAMVKVMKAEESPAKAKGKLPKYSNHGSKIYFDIKDHGNLFYDVY